jgi:hypothetical protein
VENGAGLPSWSVTNTGTKTVTAFALMRGRPERRSTMPPPSRLPTSRFCRVRRLLCPMAPPAPVLGRPCPKFGRRSSRTAIPGATRLGPGGFPAAEPTCGRAWRLGWRT